jgi:ssRNA-specific RNase YbeY (16S rRNA maturation enzyme)
MESKPIIAIQDMVHTKSILKKTQCLKWLMSVVDKNAEITIRIVDNDESQNLNNIYRKKNILQMYFLSLWMMRFI